MKTTIFFLFTLVSLNITAQKLYDLPENVETRWASFENPKAKKGAAAQENKGAKGHPFDRIPAGESIELVNVKGRGVINRIWLTISDRSPEMLRSLKIEMFWDGKSQPAVSVPLGDFFGVGLGKRVAFESAFFSDPEGRSFNCIIPMPFKTGARITVTNESDKQLDAIFYDVNMVQKKHEGKDLLYFHAYWSRDLATAPGTAFTILPEVEGKGRFLGTNIGIFTNKKYEGTWFGEGEVKIYIDGDTDYPSLAGSGTEDYIGTAYGQGTYSNQYQGSLVANKEQGAFAFYRYHIPDPVYFYNDIKVTIQQMGGAPTNKVRELVKNGAELIPVTVDHAPNFTKLLEMENPPKLGDEDFPMGWTNFYRSDDVSATAYFYLNNPTHHLPTLQPQEIRAKNLNKAEIVKNDL